MNQINRCPIYNRTDSHTYIKLKDMPIVNNLCDTMLDSLNVDKYPLSVQMFQKSGLHCLNSYVDSDILFKNYTFKSSISNLFKQHCYQGALYLSKLIKELNPLIVDIGGNDGALLELYIKVFNGSFVNILPSNIYKLSLLKNINTINDYFTDDIARDLYNSVDIVTTTNVFQHLYDINSFTKNVKTILKNDGVWVLLFPYWYNGLNTLQFDQIYHLHIYYYTILAINNLINKHGLYLQDIQKVNIHGGSLRVVIGKRCVLLSDTVKLYIHLLKLNSRILSKEFSSRVDLYINECKLFLNNIIQLGKTIYGYGASAKGCIFLNQAGIDYNTIKYVIDDTDVKQFKYIPGTGIQIKDFKYLSYNKPDYVLVLSHNVAKLIISKVKSVNDNIKCITMFPLIKVV